MLFHAHTQESPKRRFTWEAEKGEYTPRGPCGTDLIVRRRLLKPHDLGGGKWEWREDTKRVHLSAFILSKDGRTGAFRLRVDIGDERWGAPGCGRYYLHKVAAWCFHKGRHGSELGGLSWPEFADDGYWEGDHLVDGCMVAKPELALAGHVEVVPAHVNRWRAQCAAAARAAMVEAADMEAAAKAEAEAFARLRAKAQAKAKPKARRLADFAAPAGPAARAVGSADKAGRGMRLEFDVSWEHALACARGFEKDNTGDDDDDVDPGRNPCAGCLFVQMETQALGLPANAPEWRRARASLLAYCLVKQHRQLFGAREE